MRKVKLMGKTFGIALVFVLIWAMLGGLLAAPFPFTKFTNQSQALAQAAPELEWSKTFGGAEIDQSYSVQQTSDGGYIIAGMRDSYNASSGDVWLIKTDSGGNKLWDKTFGGAQIDLGYSVQQTSDGGYVIAGMTYSYGAGNGDVWLIKTDSGGNKAWDKTFGGAQEDMGLSVQQTSDSGYIIAGMTHSYGAGDCDVWLVKTDSGGNRLWDKTFGGAQLDWGYAVQQTSDSGYIIAGETYSYGAGDGDVWLIKADSGGNKAWDKTFGGVEQDWSSSVKQISDGGYIIVGSTGGYVWLIKTDSGGNKLWDKTFGGGESHSVQQTSDGGYIIAGSWLIKTDSGGNKLWDKTFAGGGFSVQQTSDGGYIICGCTESYGAGNWDVWLIKVRVEANNPPNTPSNPSPSNHATVVSINGDLSWTAADPDTGDTVTYDVYFGTSATPPLVSNDQPGTTYDPGTLAYNTKCYWKIIATDNHAASATGPLWDLTTETPPPPTNNPPNTPSNPTPSDCGTGILVKNADLTWTSGDPDPEDTVAYDVYFGNNSTPPLRETIGPYPATQLPITYDPGTLVNDVTYFWKIVARDNHGVTREGPLWYFTTAHEEEVLDMPIWFWIIVAGGAGLLVGFIVGARRGRAPKS